MISDFDIICVTIAMRFSFVFLIDLGVIPDTYLILGPAGLPNQRKFKVLTALFRNGIITQGIKFRALLQCFRVTLSISKTSERAHVGTSSDHPAMWPLRVTRRPRVHLRDEALPPS